MKILISFFLLIVISQTSISAQQADDNTLAINNYFQITNNKPIAKPTTLPNTNAQSYVNLVQRGVENKTYINSLQTGDNQAVNQTGNENNYEYYNYYSVENSNLIINQEGNQNSLQLFGENSLMKNAIINQKSSFKSLVIKNYTN